MPLQAADLGDLIKTTLNELGEMKFTEIATDLQKYLVMGRLLKKNKVVFDAGPEVQWDVMTDHSHAAQFVGLYATDNVNVPEYMAQGHMPWRHVTTNWAVERREAAMNRSPRRIVDLVKTRRIASMISLVEKMEHAFWRCPPANDNVSPHGVPYWVVKNNTEGFNGGVATGYTTTGGLSPTQYPRWQNWTAQYAAVSKDDLVRKLRKACTFTDFEPPVENIPTFNTGDSYGLYTNYAVIGAMEEILEAQNDDLGTDVASMDGKVMFRRSPMTWVPKLEEDTTNPVYGLNWGEFKTMGLRGEWLNETPIPIQPGQHTVSANHVDSSFNWFTRNRRRHFVVATGTTMPA